MNNIGTGQALALISADSNTAVESNTAVDTEALTFTDSEAALRYDDILEVSLFQGKPVLTIPVGFNFNFAFGYSKAVVLGAYLDEIKTFVSSEGKRAGSAGVVISEYKKHPILEIPTHKPKYPIRIGLGKARAVVRYAREIAQFVADYDDQYAGIKEGGI